MAHIVQIEGLWGIIKDFMRKIYGTVPGPLIYLI
jgi:hypothetical protein